VYSFNNRLIQLLPQKLMLLRIDGMVSRGELEIIQNSFTDGNSGVLGMGHRQKLHDDEVVDARIGDLITRCDLATVEGDEGAGEPVDSNLVVPTVGAN
jgi:hypothetical protein